MQILERMRGSRMLQIFKSGNLKFVTYTVKDIVVKIEIII